MSLNPTSFTANQQAAIATHDRNLIVMAGAGSGKTRVLVERYLALLAANPHWRLNNLVAITFTKEAALEMRGRVRDTLLVRADDTRSTAEERQRYSRLLAEMDSARINTIHSLCDELLRANAAAAGLDPGFSVLDEAQARLLAHEAYQATLHELQQHDPAGILQLFRLYRANDVLETATDMRLLALAWPDSSDASAFISAWLHKSAALKDDVRADKWVYQADFEQQAAEQTYRWLRLLAHVQATYSARKRAQALLDFNDLEAFTVALLRHPAVVARYRQTEVKHLLVDEFQDTNAAQWEIVKALADLERGGSLFVVGDIKQSIYGFRGADVSVFAQVQSEIPASGGETVELTDSFRSHAALVTALNEAFTAIFPADLRSDKAQKAGASSAAGYDVKAAPLHSSRSLPMQGYKPIEFLLQVNPAHPKNRYAKVFNAEQLRLWEAFSIAEHLKQMMADGVQIWDKDKGRDAHRALEWGDVALLFRTKSHMALYEAVFKAQGVPYVTIAGKGFYDRQEVWDILNLLRALATPSDDLALGAVLRAPYFALSDDALYALRRVAPAGTFWEALHAPADSPAFAPLSAADASALAHARHTLATLQQMAGRASIAELLRALYSATGYLALLTGLPNGARLRANLLKLVEIAEASQAVTLGQFIAYADALSAAETREGEASQATHGALRLMTIHASKGLEFPVVVLADSNGGGNRRSATLEVLEYTDEGSERELLIAAKLPILAHVETDEERSYKPAIFQAIVQMAKDREAEEDKRLLYVAATRARDYLIISGGLSLTGNGFSYQGTQKAWQTAFSLPTQATKQAEGAHWRARYLHLPTADATEIATSSADIEGYASIPRTTSSAWERLPSAPATAPSTPPNAAPLRLARKDAPRHISATQLYYWGSYRHELERDETRAKHYKQRFLQDIASADPNRAVPPVQLSRSQARIIGSVVHNALRHWHLPNAMPTEVLNDILKSYAWHEGISAIAEQRIITNQAWELLSNFAQTALYTRIQAALDATRPVYPELPFLLHAGKLILHGQMDLLFQDADGTWVIVDYKTSALSDPAYAAWDARRYHGQMGAYALAVEQRFGFVPQTIIHYIQAKTSVTVAEDAWRAAIVAIQREIEQVFDEPHRTP